MPRKRQFAGEIVELNRALQRIANAHDDVTYVDLWPALATAEGSLRSQYTNDSLHLNGAGYAAWVQVLRPFLSKLSKTD
jgi:lysophospholipase L1-like esterase